MKFMLIKHEIIKNAEKPRTSVIYIGFKKIVRVRKSLSKCSWFYVIIIKYANKCGVKGFLEIERNEHIIHIMKRLTKEETGNGY